MLHSNDDSRRRGKSLADLIASFFADFLKLVSEARDAAALLEKEFERLPPVLANLGKEVVS